MLRAVLVDAEGPLANASELHFQALNRALATKGWLISFADHRMHYEGLPTTEKLKRLTEMRGFPKEWHPEILDLKQQLTRDVMRDFFKPLDPMKYFFQGLKRAGVKVGLISSMHGHTLHFLAEILGISGSVDVLVGHDSVGFTRLKPHPDLYQFGMAQLGVTAASSVVVLQDHTSMEAALKCEPLDIVIANGPGDLNGTLLNRLLWYHSALDDAA